VSFTKRAWLTTKIFILSAATRNGRGRQGGSNLAVAWHGLPSTAAIPRKSARLARKPRRSRPKKRRQQLMIAWVSKVQEGDFLGGITAMNDMLEMYPMTSISLSRGQLADGRKWRRPGAAYDGEGARHRQKFPSCPERSCLCRCRNRKFANAFAAMDRYVACFPSSPIRRIPTENCCAWQETSKAHSRTIAPRLRSIPTS